jgi:hypothetical protein
MKMTWTELIRDKRVAAEPTSKHELTSFAKWSRLTVV